MLPPSSFTMRRAHEVQPGQFARLLDHGNAPIVAGTINGLVVAVFIEPADKRCNTAEVKDLSGPAMVFSDVEFQIDPLVCEKLDFMDLPAGSLAMKGNELLILGVPPSNLGYIPIKLQELTTEGSHVAHGFREWRIVHRFGDQEYQLFHSNP